MLRCNLGDCLRNPAYLTPGSWLPANLSFTIFHSPYLLVPPYQKSSFNTYAPSLAPYVSIVPTSSSALLIRPPSAIQQQQASSILIGSGGLNNNPSILAQSPSNLGEWGGQRVRECVYIDDSESFSSSGCPFWAKLPINNNGINIHYGPRASFRRLGRPFQASNSCEGSKARKMRF